ncbi:excisionase family DNA-binding protein [Corynebacterium lizhenjunii]|uniref:excisionase family DNA-binding protein n=1 Tax=Corynebacterium lizhenjunii TaxID=2709394 RepID=UPI0013E9EC6E|nr:excisionase family DNA-binding protein [Corynebacterium lizhenjunii]
MESRDAWLRVKEAASYMNIHPQTLYTLLQRGEVRSARRGRTYLIRREWCDNYLEATAA